MLQQAILFISSTCPISGISAHFWIALLVSFDVSDSKALLSFYTKQDTQRKRITSKAFCIYYMETDSQLDAYNVAVLNNLCCILFMTIFGMNSPFMLIQCCCLFNFLLLLHCTPQKNRAEKEIETHRPWQMYGLCEF